MNLKQHIGIKIHSARKKMGLTQEQLAALVGKATETVSNIERGQVHSGLETLENIAKQLGVSVSDFFEGVDRSKRLSQKRLQQEEEANRLISDLKNDHLKIAVEFLRTLGKHEKDG